MKVFHFIIHGKSTNPIATINLRMRIGRNVDFKMSTQLNVPVANWDKKLGAVKNAKTAELKELVVTGLICIGIALIWNLHFPIFKRMWTSSFIMLTSGLAFLSMGLFYLIIDILKFQKWAFFFVVVGMNSLTIYMIYRFVNFRYTSRLLFEGLYKPLGENWMPVMESLGALGLVWLFLYFLYRKKIFFKV